MSHGKLRPQRDGLANVAYRLAGRAARQFHGTEQVQRIDIVRIALEQVPIDSLGIIKAPGALVL